MAKSVRPDPRAARFINIDLRDDERKKFKAWSEKSAAGIGSLIDKVVDSGYSISAKPDGFNGGYAAYITAQDPKSPLSGWILSARASTASNAILGAIFRHLVLWEGNWPVDVVRRNTFDDE